MKFGVISFFAITEEVIQDILIVEAENLEDAIRKTEINNMELNIAFPLNQSNKEGFENLLKNWD